MALVPVESASPVVGTDGPVVEFDGETLVERAVRALHDSGQVDRVRVQETPGRHPEIERADVLVVHHPMRALTPVSVIRSVIDTVLTGAAAAAVPAQPVTDTIKRVEPGSVLRGTWQRERLRAIQSPLCCRTGLVEGVEHTPTVADLPPERIQLVAGDPLGMRLSTRFDIQVAEALGAASPTRGGG